MKLTESKLKTVFHISPEKGVQKLTPKYSPKFKKKGIFVSPSMKSIIIDWAGYVASKKGQKARKQGQVHDTKQEYTNLTIYQLTIPNEDLQRAKEFHEMILNQAAETMGNEGKFYAAWQWGEEVFIPEELLSNLSISGRKTYEVNDIYKLAERHFFKKNDIYRQKQWSDKK